MNKKIKFGVYVGVTAVCLVLLILTVISSITLLSEKLDEGNMGQSIEDYDYDLYNGEYDSMRDSLSFICRREKNLIPTGMWRMRTGIILNMNFGRWRPNRVWIPGKTPRDIWSFSRTFMKAAVPRPGISLMISPGSWYRKSVLQS